MSKLEQNLPLFLEQEKSTVVKSVSLSGIPSGFLKQVAVAAGLVPGTDFSFSCLHKTNSRLGQESS